ncbi:hypothetical protein [Flavobacterium tructae]|uniref:Uncharacterized protein n=1 Tax=Flavobacterium tructae TaxID=1114873 RepID=A0A1S1J839_9FLAO|nr:hypothetical protein [Flavobacterium tructae]OHT45669.1 hypothetical protein BHE19_07500 [Flavobacterium tructae]OXB18328.1 hypothetical protein B0A71_15525 [Flavobacterium tructae]
MTQNIYLLAFGTFGNPYGFRQTFFKMGNENVAKSIKTFDLNTNAIKLFENSSLYAIRKESANGLNSISYSKYSFAKEKNSDRGGTFIGASILFTNEIAEENVTINKLNEFHKILVSKNIEDKTLMVNHSDNFTVDLPQDYDKLSYNLKSFNEPSSFYVSNSNLVVYSKINIDKLQHNFKKSLELLNRFDTIFFTDNEEIANFSHSKGLYRTTNEEGFDNEIQIAKEEKKKQLQLILNDYEKEISELEENKIISIKKLKESIEQNVRLHQENGRKIEESKKQITATENKYAEFSKKIREAINFIKSNRKIDEVKSFHQENKREFLNFINENTKPQYLNQLNNVQPKTNITTQYASGYDFLQPNDTFQTRRSEKTRKTYKIFKPLSILFFTLWILTLLYFLFSVEILEMLRMN